VADAVGGLSGCNRNKTAKITGRLWPDLLDHEYCEEITTNVVTNINITTDYKNMWYIYIVSLECISISYV
jgi:hypothetical protein